MTRSRRTVRAPWALLALGYLAVVGWVTIGPAPWRTGPTEDDYDVLSTSTWLDSDTWSGGGSGEFLANILLFVPVGLLLRLAVPRATWLGAVVLGGAVSTVIEIAQMWTPRVSDPRDIVANTTGALAGALLGAIVGAASRARRAARQSTARPPSMSASSSRG